jgi:hypothetical protein
MPKTHPADPVVEDRKRIPFAGAGPQHTVREHLTQTTALPRGPTYDIVVESYDSDTVPVFCKKNRISVAFYYKLKLQGKTPREMHLGNKRLISKESAEQWRKDREAEAAKKTTV